MMDIVVENDAKYKLSFVISGDDINVKIINAIRRIGLKYIPIYAFPPELITITKNTSRAFNNDYMKQRLSNLPVYGINPIKDDNSLIEIYIKYINKTNDIYNLTTNDIEIKINNESVKPYNKDKPILLIQLRPNDEFICYMKAQLNIGLTNAIWNSANNIYYNILGTNKFRLVIERNDGQFDGYQLLDKTCSYIIQKLTNIKNYIDENIKINNNNVILDIKKEDSSIGELLNYEFQSNKNIKISGISEPNKFVEHIIIKMIIEKDIKETIIKSINNIIEKIEKIQKIKHKFK